MNIDIVVQITSVSPHVYFGLPRQAQESNLVRLPHIWPISRVSGPPTTTKIHPDSPRQARQPKHSLMPHLLRRNSPDMA
ncbi:hypothetical protein L211DRAFT_497387 [Terfezia boudieri ATCC MYA-4762]|uniref:Uncharacterized protein n=1 Tax=Terfezia boudieri ATCC MYA-4762 TaxID=1051890 RepID=A0A3N4LS86_9PEZI|nr:hypothetical protein L211DRAFT_497387 [Terfezia boudieri ATCC MYA-4762]